MTGNATEAPSEVAPATKLPNTIVMERAKRVSGLRLSIGCGGIEDGRRGRAGGSVGEQMPGLLLRHVREPCRPDDNYGG